MQLFRLILLALLVGSLASCSVLKHPALDMRSTKGELKKYEQSANPKPVIKFLFRHGREIPANDELLEIAEWSTSNRIHFIRLIDKMRGEYKETFIEKFSEVLGSSKYKSAFLKEFGTSKAPSIQRIVSKL